MRQQSLGDDGFGLFAYDNYQLTAKLPANLQPEQVLQMMAKDLNGTIGNAQFDKINEFSTNSAPKVGDIYNIDIVGPVDGKVVLSRLEPNYFVFTTVADQAGNHPESGSREFGFQRNDDGTVTFYTRGASRNTDLGALSWGPFGAAQVLTAGTFQSLGWMALMEGLKNQLAASDARNIKVDDPTIFLNSDPSNCTNITPMRSALFAANIANAAGANTDETPSMVYYRLDYIRTIGNGEGFSTLRGQARNGGTARLVLPANVSYQITSFDPATGRIGIARGASTQETVASDIFLSVVQFEVADRDGDGLTDVAEFILATNEANPDTDGDGISDGAEVQQGSNPLNGFIATTGIIASVPTAAPATDIYALNNVAVTANGAAGISVFNVLSGLNPTRIADVDTPGLAMCVASNGNFVAVADYLSGLAIVDISDPAAVRLSAQVNLGAAVQSVTVNGGLAIAGTTTGQIVTVDLATATVLGRVNLPAGAVIQDLTVWRDTLYALQVGKLTALDVNTLAIQGSLTLSGSMGAGQRRWRLFAGEGTLYATHTSGFNIVDTGTNPNAPTLVQNFNTAQFGWKQIVANGSGLGLAATSPNSTNDGPHNIDLYTLGAEGRTPAFGTTFETPGLAAALSIYNGLAYVADSESGLQVISYLPYDSQGQAPTISIKSNFTLNAADKTGTAEEGKLMRLSATVTDDVQVRNVEFYVDGQLLITDGNYPFEHRFATPAISAGNPNFKVKAKATDTGGNVAWTDEFTITLVPDATPPQVLTVSPGNNAITGALTSLYASFSEPMNADTLATGFKLTEAGPDKSLGTADDVLSTGEISYRENIRTAFMTFASPGLQPGSYRITLQAPAADGAGNAIATPFLSSFRVYNASLDTDGDGIPDEYEALLGLNPTKADTNNNGILDGNEDFDNDGLKNSAEFYLMTNPIIADTNGNGILDGNEDSDLDGLKDGLEAQYGTNALLVDSDGDGFDDATEIAEGSDPNVGGNQRPLTRVRSSMVSLLNAAPEPTPANLATTAASATITYLNSTTEPLPGNLANAAASKAVSYLNAATEPLPPALDNAAASKAVSYLNAATEPLPASRDAQSGQVSYRNNP
ncbi:MAG: Ig-like domain-containing protein [Prosthecobacter sp.]